MTETNPVPGGTDYGSQCMSCGAVTAAATGFDDWWAGNGHNPTTVETIAVFEFRRETARRAWVASTQAECPLAHLECEDCGEFVPAVMESHKCPITSEAAAASVDAIMLDLYAGVSRGWRVGSEPLPGDAFTAERVEGNVILRVNSRGSLVGVREWYWDAHNYGRGPSDCSVPPHPTTVAEAVERCEKAAKAKGWI